ncbi:MAG: 3-phosphoshikimate 1-carboxyvinyltransferase [Candidatus Dormiibacterota bacterium]
MSAVLARRQRPLSGRCQVPSDKAISHRAALLAACCPETSRIENFSPAGDCRATVELVRSLGCPVGERGGVVEVTGLEADPAAREFPRALDCRRSGTTMRLGAGLLAGLPFSVGLTGDPQLLQRPMERIAAPLRLMGAEVATAPGGRPPLELRGGGLVGIDFTPLQASAQVKSAVLLAGLRASSTTTVREPIPTRDHTERLLRAMGARLAVSEEAESRSVALTPGSLEPLDLRVPGDASSAAVLAAAAALVPGSQVVLESVSINPGRIGFFEVLRRMGGVVEVEPQEELAGPEPVADIRVGWAPLQAFQIGAAEVPYLIDELPLLGLLATVAEGTSEVRGARELRVKESDRIAGLVAGLRALGGDAEELPDGFVVRGPSLLRGCRCDAHLDHRLAMTFSLAGLVSEGAVEVEGAEFVADSFPGFQRILEGMS